MNVSSGVLLETHFRYKNTFSLEGSIKLKRLKGTLEQERFERDDKRKILILYFTKVSVILYCSSESYRFTRSQVTQGLGAPLDSP